MSKNNRSARRSLIRYPVSVALLVGTLSSCGGSAGGTPDAGIKSITVSPTTVAVAVGDETSLSATAKDAQGSTLSNVTYTWKSSNETVARVADGTVTGLVAGSATVTASAGGVSSAPVAVNVTAPAAFDLALSTDRLPVITGTGASLTVNVARRGTFTGAVTLNLQGLPAGASAAPVTIAENQTTATVTVNAAPTAPHSFPTAVTLRAMGGDHTVTRAVTITVRGPAGSLDTTFGVGGSRTVDFGGKDDYATAMVMQPDGKIVLAGSAPGASGEGIVFAVARLDRDGNPDPAFGQGGKVRVNFGSGNDQAYAVALQSDGRIVVGGFADVGTNRDFGLTRLNVDGSVDTDFGTGGKVTTPIGTAADRAYALAVQPDGKIVLGGTSDSGGATGLDFALARYTAKGQLDDSFGTGGKVRTAVAKGSASDVVYALAVHEGSILAAGGETDFMLAKYTASGTLDGSFGVGGKMTGLFGSTVGAARGLTVTRINAQDRVLLAGNANNDTAVARLTLSGALDTAFGDGGRKVIPVSVKDWDEASALAVQADGKVIVGGWANDATTTSNFTALRLTQAGQPNPSFGEGGLVVTPLAPSGKNDRARALLLQPDDRIPTTRVVLAGDRVPGFSDFAATRYWP